MKFGVKVRHTNTGSGVGVLKDTNMTGNLKSQPMADFSDPNPIRTDRGILNLKWYGSVL
jgi:hypothetical protein